MTVTIAQPETTFSKFAGQRARSWCSMPSIDVPVIEGEPRHCAQPGCGEAIEYDRSVGYHGEWVHVEGEAEHYVRPTSICEYCGTQDPTQVKFVQAAWSDETRCTRCGGVSGFGIGD